MALTIDFTNSIQNTNTSVNAVSYTTGATGAGTGGLVANVTTLFIGNNTINAYLTTTGLSINAVTTANTTGVYTTGTVNAASYTTGDGGGASGGLTANVTTINLGNTTVNTVATYTTVAVSNATTNTTLASRYLQISASSGQPIVNLVNQNSSVGGRPAINFYASNTTTTTQFFGGLNWLASNAAGSFATTASITAQGDSFTSYKADIIAAVNANSNIVLQAGGSASNTLVGNSTGVYLFTNTFTVGTGSYFVANGFVGIGTASPAYKLDVNGAGIRLQGTQPTIFSKDTSAAGSAAYTGYLMQDSAGTSLSFIGKSSAGSSDASFINYLSGGQLGLSQVGAGYIYFTTNASERMRIDSSGNVGIGTTSPSSFASQFVVQTADSVNTIVATAATALVRIGAYISSKSAGTIEALNTAQSAFSPLWFGGSILQFATSGSEAMRIGSSGNVGIGTSSPGAKLDIRGITFIGDSTTRLAIYSDNSSAGVSLEAANYANDTKKNLYLAAYGGNVGIGTTSPSSQLSVANDISAGGGLFFGPNANYWYQATSTQGTLRVGASSNYAYFNFLSNGGIPTIGGYTLAFSGNGSTEAMRIDTSGNLLIGTTSAYGKLFVSQTNNNTCAFFSLESGAGAGYIATRVNTNLTTQKNMTLEYLGVAKGTFKTDLGAVYFDGTQGTTIFQTAGAEAMRIDSSGNLLVGTTVNTTTAKFALQQGAAAWTQFCYLSNASNGIGITNTSGTASYYGMAFYNNGTTFSTCGSIIVGGTSVAYNTTSDYRMKENAVPMTTGLATVNSLKPIVYDWISTKEKGEGFLAHELQSVIPLAVSGEKDAVDEDGKMQPQSVDYSKIVVHLVAAIQELSAKNDALAAANAAFESRLAALETK